MLTQNEMHALLGRAKNVKADGRMHSFRFETEQGTVNAEATARPFSGTTVELTLNNVTMIKQVIHPVEAEQLERWSKFFEYLGQIADTEREKRRATEAQCFNALLGKKDA